MRAHPLLIVSRATQRRFILGKQGLYPGRRWQGKEGVAHALHAGCAVQIDPLTVVARSHDIMLYGRVLNYEPAHLATLLYTDRQAFDYGGTVMVHRMEELPYWRTIMARKQQEARWVAFAAEHAHTIDAVRAAVQARGPLSSRDIASSVTRGSISGPGRPGSFRSNQVSSQALYYLWLAGDLMTHSRRGWARVYDLRERIAPPHLDYAAPADESEAYFALQVLQRSNILTARSWRNAFAGTIVRKVELAEATERLQALLAAGTVVPVGVEDEPQAPRLILAADFSLLERLHVGELPDAWQPLETSTDDEMTFLAPLEPVSARGRALDLFGFEYLWEVYKPAAQRRWGYYTLPILYGDRLVARLDPRLDRTSRTLVIKGFWLEESTTVDAAFLAALAAACRRFMHFVGAERTAVEAQVPQEVGAVLSQP
ncbi:MAG TPA: crosslink repair DNA glycosylase YcaQ family protein [Chloroflexia bacterium]|nr:crosslink repair DNA glycosylase YcaQ family protein [Chloroflexia bacterium]